MNIPLVAIFAGLFGTIVGVGISVWLSFSSRREASCARLRALLFANGYRIWWGDASEPWQIIEANRVEIHAEYLTLRSLTIWRTRRLDNAWADYTGVKHYHQLGDYEPGKLFAKSAVTREEAIVRTIGLIKGLA